MNIFVYSDESGVFDKKHNNIFVFGGIVFLSKNSRDICSRKYSKAENDVKKSKGMDHSEEAKASVLDNKSKAKLYRSLNNVIKFGIVIQQDRVYDDLFRHKKVKQRYQDYAFKIGIKRCFEFLIAQRVINVDDVENIYFNIDEHATATDGCYELEEALEHEFKIGTHNFDRMTCIPPLFPSLNCVQVEFHDSKAKLLVRAADIVANRIYHHAITGYNFCNYNDNPFITIQP